jgi:hypothetical protein
MTGIKISTFTRDMQLIDDSEEYFLDATSFLPQPLSQDMVQIEVSEPYAGELSNYSISF